MTPVASITVEWPAQASLDLVAMMCKGLGIRPQDEYRNLEGLELLASSSRDVLIEAKGLYNHLVHRYNRIDDLLALESMKNLLVRIMTFGSKGGRRCCRHSLEGAAISERTHMVGAGFGSAALWLSFPGTG